MTKRWDEELCKDAALDYARSLGHGASVRPGDDCNKSPDYVATIDSTEYALEVTRVTSHLAMHDGSAKPHTYIGARLSKLVAEISRRAACEQISVGHLSIGLFASEVPDLTRCSEAIIDLALNFVAGGHGRLETRDVILPLDERRSGTVRFCHDPTGPGTRIEPFLYDYLPAAPPTHSLRNALDNRLAEKRRLMVSETRPKILVLGDFFMVASKYYRDAFAGLKAEDFAAILVVCSRRKTIALAWRIPPLTS